MSGKPNTFSAVLLGDLNDFINPGLACINPIFTDPPNPSAALPKGPKKLELAFDDFKPSLIRLDKKSQAAKVSLTDCLACSGCVTSAETVLLKQQSATEFGDVVNAMRLGTHPSFKVAVATVSPQVRASFAARFGVSNQDAFGKICDLLRRLCGVELVLDAGAVAADIAQMEVATEFVEKFKAGKANPMLTSNCPGFVCYAEKTHPILLPLLCDVKSPQQVSGLLAKRLLGQSRGLATNQIYHVSIMQCPDKKLEGARKEFWMNENDVLSSEVNCVLTATELCEVMLDALKVGNDDLDVAFQSLSSTAMPFDFASPEVSLARQHPNLQYLLETGATGEEPEAGGSGSLCAYVFRYASRELFGVIVPPGPLPFKQGKNPDTWSIDLEIDGRVVLRFGASYGFRNIQDVVRRVKIAKNATHFIEVMACPGGCTNGGGLLHPTKSEDKKLLIAEVARVLNTVPYRAPETNKAGKIDAVTSLLNLPTANLRTTFNDVKSTSRVGADGEMDEQSAMMQGW